MISEDASLDGACAVSSLNCPSKGSAGGPSPSPSSSSTVAQLPDDVWLAILQFMTAEDLLLRAAVTSRRLFRLVVGDVAARAQLWREMWLAHLLTGSSGGGGFGTLVQDLAVVESSCSNADVGAPTALTAPLDDASPGDAVQLSYHLLHSPSVKGQHPQLIRHSPPPIRLPPVRLVFRPAARPMDGTSSRNDGNGVNTTGGCGGGSAQLHKLLRTVAESVLNDSAGGSGVSRDGTAARPHATPNGSNKKIEGHSGVAISKHVEEDALRLQEHAFVYSKALQYLHRGSSAPQLFLDGPVDQSVQIIVFMQDGQRENADCLGQLDKMIELRNALRDSWRACLYAQMERCGARRADPLRDDGNNSPRGRDTRSGNSLFDANALMSRAKKREDVYRGIIEGLREDVSDGIGIIFPVCVSAPTMETWQRLHREGVSSRAADGRGIIHEHGQSGGEATAAAEYVRNLRRQAEQEEQQVMSDATLWAAPRRYIMGPFYSDDDTESSSSSSGNSSSNNGAAGGGDKADGKEDARGRTAAAPRSPRGQPKKRAWTRVRAAQLERRRRLWQAQEAEWQNAGVYYGSTCIHGSSSSSDDDEDGHNNNNNNRSGGGNGTTAVPVQDELYRVRSAGRIGGDDGSSSTSLAIETDDDDDHVTGTAGDGGHRSRSSSLSFRSDNEGPEQQQQEPPVATSVNPLHEFYQRPTAAAASASGDDESGRNIHNNDSASQASESAGSSTAQQAAQPIPPGSQPFTQPVAFLFPLPHMMTYLYLLQHVVITEVKYHVWLPDEIKCSIIARIVSPTGDSVETRFFSSHLSGMYPRVYMKMSFTPGDLPHTLFNEKMQQANDPPPQSSSDDDDDDGDDSDMGNNRDGDGSSNGSTPRRGDGTRAAGMNAGGKDIAVTEANDERVQTPTTPAAGPTAWAFPQHAKRTTSGGSKAAAGSGRRGRKPESAASWRRRTFRHRATLDFPTIVDVFCGGFGRVEVDIPPSVSKRGLDVLRTVLGLPADFPMSLLWNVVVHASGMGRSVWQSHISTFLYHYQTTFTDAVERAFGLRECYGPLNDLRPRESPSPAAHPQNNDNNTNDDHLPYGDRNTPSRPPAPLQQHDSDSNSSSSSSRSGTGGGSSSSGSTPPPPPDLSDGGDGGAFSDSSGRSSSWYADEYERRGEEATVSPSGFQARLAQRLRRQHMRDSDSDSSDDPPPHHLHGGADDDDQDFYSTAEASIDEAWREAYY